MPVAGDVDDDSPPQEPATAPSEERNLAELMTIVMQVAVVLVVEALVGVRCCCLLLKLWRRRAGRPRVEPALEVPRREKTASWEKNRDALERKEKLESE